MYAQPVTNTKLLKFGSMGIEASDDNGSSFYTLGALNKVKFTEKITSQDITTDTGGFAFTLVKEQTAEIAGNMVEINPSVINRVRGGIDTYTPVAGSPTAITGEALGTGWVQGKPIKLKNKNGANTVVTSIVIKAAGSALAANTDYRTYVGNDSNGELGYTYITPITSQAGVLTADYSYTPNAAEKLSTGGKTTISPQIIRLTNTNAAGKIFRITIYCAQNTEGINLDIPGEDEGKIWELPIKFNGRKDANRTEGDMLYEIYNEQLAA